MPLMAGKQGLIMGVANERSIAWGIAKALHCHGAALAFTYQGEALGKRVRPLAESLDSDFVLEADVASEDLLLVHRCVPARRAFDDSGRKPLDAHLFRSGAGNAALQRHGRR